ncbi:MAG: hypothetical protein KGV51_01620 [Moraxellaceae bacterium]|nr:hypothetical protein [Moraxellaceae bacterium]
MFKKIIFASVLALAFNGTAYAKQIMTCWNSAFGLPSYEIECTKSDNSSIFKTNLKKLYSQGWRLIDVEGFIADGTTNGVSYFLEK